MRRLTVIFALGALVALTTAAAAATYDIDKSHSSVGFKVRHLGVSNVRGFFGDFAGAFEFDTADPGAWRTEAAIQIASVDTGDPKRDEHLRTPDFFDAVGHPTMVFKSTSVTKASDGAYKLAGDLTLRGVTRSVQLDLELLGTATDPWGNDRAGFSATGRINRQDFGVNWSTTLDAGGLVVGNEVTIMIEVEGILRK